MQTETQPAQDYSLKIVIVMQQVPKHSRTSTQNVPYDKTEKSNKIMTKNQNICKNCRLFHQIL